MAQMNTDALAAWSRGALHWNRAVSRRQRLPWNEVRRSQICVHLCNLWPPFLENRYAADADRGDASTKTTLIWSRMGLMERQILFRSPACGRGPARQRRPPRSGG